MEGRQLPQYHRNNLSPAKIDKESLQTIFRELQSAIRHGVDLLQNNVSLPDDPKEYGSIYSGTAGTCEFSFIHSIVHVQEIETKPKKRAQKS